MIGPVVLEIAVRREDMGGLGSVFLIDKMFNRNERVY